MFISYYLKSIKNAIIILFKINIYSYSYIFISIIYNKMNLFINIFSNKFL